MPPPRQKPGRSKQDYGTPKDFLDAVRHKLHIADFDIDLAATSQNTVCAKFYSEKDNAFQQPWKVGDGWNWLNPPFARISPWVERAYAQSQLGARTAVLVPAAVGSNWWARWVDGKAHALLLNGRITFVGELAPYIKDCALLLYSRTYPSGYQVWNWKAVIE